MDSLTTLITNSTFKPALANGFHTLKLSGEQHKALKSLVEENAELKKKLEHKEDKIEDHLASCNFYEEQCQELKQEIKELDSYAKKHEQDNRILRFSTIGMTEEIDKLKEKNNKWTYWASDVIYWCNTHNKDILQSKKLIDGENKPTIDNVRDFGKEITELKEENSILRDINQKRIPALIRRWNEEDAEENEKLKEEIDELKEKMDSICIELYAFWNCEDPDPHAVNIGDICGYDEDKHKKLYEKKYPGNVWFSDDEE